MAGRWLGLLLLVLGLSAGLLFLGTRDQETPSNAEPLPTPTSEHPVREDPTLVGMPAPPPPDAFERETDLQRLLQHTGIGTAAQARILQLASSRPALIAELVQWLRPERDADRVPPLPPGRRVSSRGVPGLDALYDTLVRLAPASIAPLVAALDDEDLYFRLRIVECLGRMEARGAPAVPALVARLRPEADEVAVQIRVFEALARMGEAARAALPVFETYVRDARMNDDVRAAAAGGYPRAAGPTAEAFETASVALRDQSYEVCVRLIPALGDQGPEAAPIVPELLAIVADPEAHDYLRQHAIEAVGRIGAGGGKAASMLLDIVADEDGDDRLRSSAMRALAGLGREALDALFRQVASAEVAMRFLAFRILQPLDTVAEGDLLALLETMRKDPEAETRVDVVYLAERFAPASGARLDFLVRWLDDPDDDVRVAAIDVLSQTIDPSGRVVATFARMLEDPDARFRRCAMEGLVRRLEGVGDVPAEPHPADLVDRVGARLKDDDASVRRQAASWLAFAAPAYDERALPVWIEILEGDLWWSGLAEVLGRLGPRAQAALPALDGAIARSRWPPAKKGLEELRAKIAGE